MEPVKLIVLKTGEKILTQIKAEDTSPVLILIDPLEMIISNNPFTGESAFGLCEWLPARFLKVSEIPVYQTDIFTSVLPSEKLVRYYAHCLELTKSVSVKETGGQAVRDALPPEDSTEVPAMANANTLAQLLENLDIKPTIH